MENNGNNLIEKNELIGLLSEKISQYVSNGEEVAKLILEHFCVIPQNDKTKKSVIEMKNKGVGGGKSRKSRNVYLDWEKLIVYGSESVLTIIGAASVPIIIPLAGLVVWNRLCSLLEIEIDELHAIVLWVMWKNRDDENYVDQRDIPDLVNEVLIELKKPEIDNKGINRVLTDLEKMMCIKSRGKNKWWLCERIEVGK